jgi:hypothetical protein
MEQLFDVFEVEIATPNRERKIAAAQSEKNAEAIIKMAVMRRGVDTHFFTKRPANVLVFHPC